MFTLEQLSRSLAGHIKGQLLEGNFNFISCGEYTALVEIEGKPVQIWLGNQPKNCNIYVSEHDTFYGVIGEYAKFDSEKDAIELFEMLEPYVLKLREAERKKRLLEIQKELMELEND